MAAPLSPPPHATAATENARRLAEGLSPRLRYHGPMHTFEEVLPAAVELAKRLEAAPREIELVEAAAAYHDLGYLEKVKGHEQVSVGIARRELPAFGFDDDELDAIEGMILATRLPQTPRTPLEAVLADADFAIVGQPSFMRRSEDLRLELSSSRKHVSETTWSGRQLRFLLRHRFHTDVARHRYDAGKRRNIGRIAARFRATLQE